MMMRQANKVKRTEINLNYLRNDLDLWLHRVASWIDNKKTNPLQDDIKTLGIEMVQKLCIRKVLKKKDIDDMKFPGLHLTPNRSSSASPNRHTTPDSASRRSKSITRLSPEDQHSDCQKKLDFNDDEDGYKVDADIKPATCAYAHCETYYKCRISLEQQKIKLEKELQRKTPDQDETRSYENIIQNQKKLILEIQKRDEEQKTALKDANDALEYHIRMLERCRKENNDAESILLGIKNDSVKHQCEIAQLQKCLKKQKQKSDEQIHNLKKHLKEKENDHQQGTKRFNEINGTLKEVEGQVKDISSRDRNELLQEQKNNRKLKEHNESLKEKIYEMEKNHAEEKKRQIDIESKFQHQISNLKILNSRAGKKVTHAEKELEEMISKCKEQQSLFTEYRCYSSGEGRSDTEKENISLRSELTEAFKNIERLRQEYTDVSYEYERGKIGTKMTIESLQEEKNCLEQEKVNLKAKLDQIQSDLILCKNEQVQQQDSSHGKIDNLLQQNRKLDTDRELLKAKIFSLESDKIKLEDILNKSKEDNKKLQSNQDKLQDNLREKANELKDSEVRLRKLEADILFLQNTGTENEQLKESLHEIVREFDNLEKRYKKETSDRMSSTMISTKYKDDNDRLRKERNSARIELQRVLREKNESYENLNTEQVLVREELQSKEREKSELVALFKDKEDKDLQKIKLYEKEIETLTSRCRDDNDKMRQSEHEIEFFKSRWRDHKDKIQRLEREIETLKSRYRDDNDIKRQMEHEIETLKSRLSKERSDQTVKQIGKGSIIRAQTMINHDKLFAEKSEEVTKKVSELYENKWKVAMIELGENGGKKKNIEFLLTILQNAYSFCERMEGRFKEELEQALLNAAANIKEVVDTTVFVRPILERLERCINQMFLREYSQYQEYRTREPVHTYITEALSLSWFMVTRNPRVFISTIIPKESHPQFYDSNSTNGSEVDYVVLPIVKWSTNEDEIIRKGIAAFK